MERLWLLVMFVNVFFLVFFVFRLKSIMVWCDTKVKLFFVIL